MNRDEFMQQLEKKYQFDSLQKQFCDTKEKIEKAGGSVTVTNE